MSQERLNDWHETRQTAFDLNKGYTGQPDRYNDCKINGKLPVNNTVEPL
jgi:hypothetical protein